MTVLRVVYTDGYPMLTRPEPARSYGICALSATERPHEGELDHTTGICAPCLSMLPFDVRERHTVKRSLRLWWTQYRWLVKVGLLALGYLAALLWIGGQYRQLQGVMGW